MKKAIWEKTIVFFAIMITMALTASACSPSSRLEPCDTDADCPDLQACLDGSCSQVQCKDESDCDANQYCRDYKCEAQVSCIQESDCLQDEICSKGLCQQVECKKDQDCPDGYTCVNNECAGSGCKSDDDCDPGQICIQGQCTTGCKSQRDCPAGTICLPDEGDHGMCVECIEDTDCSDGKKCVEFSCREFCSSDQDCAQGFCDTQSNLCVECVSDDQCEMGFICEQQSCQQGCRKDRDCPRGQICESDLCQDGCRQDSDCSTGKICIDGSCQDGCRNDEDCAQGQSCLDNSCVFTCTHDADCLQGEICLSGSCIEGCRTDIDCNQGVCDQNTHQCVECEDKGDCPLGNLCIDNFCTPGCEVDRDCPAGQNCAPQIGEHGTCVECNINDDCIDPDKPRCLDHQCAPECFGNEDCADNAVCVNGHCQAPAQECDLQISPEGPLDFGSVSIGQSVQLTVTLSNAGLSECNISQVELMENPLWPSRMEIVSHIPSSLVLQPTGQSGSVFDVVIEFSPVEEKSSGALLWITSDDPDLLIGADEQLCSWPTPPQVGQACIIVQGEGARQELVAIPPQVDFGKIRSDCGDVTTSVTLYNIGSDVAINDISLENSNSAFGLPNLPSFPIELLSDGDMDVRINFNPQGSGTFSNTLLVSYGTTSLEVPISGQSSSQASVIDEFPIRNNTPVDILFVVDNSGSMAEIQQELADYFECFLDIGLEGDYDFHIGVISTEINEAETDLGTPPRDVIPGVLVHPDSRPKYLTPSTPDIFDAFSDNVNIGDCCSDEQEAGLRASYMALSEPLLSGENSGFLRDDARLNIIYFSNEEDQSPASADFYVNYFHALKANDDLVSLHTICGDLPNGCSYNGVDAEAGERYIAAQQATGGSFHSICDMGCSTMEAIGEASFRPIQSFTLSARPEPSSIVVYEDNLYIPEASCNNCSDGWTYRIGDNSIFLGDSYIPPPNSTLQVSYTAICQ